MPDVDHLPTLYAVCIGINGYRNVAPLSGCVNDALCAARFFEHLCRAQPEPGINWRPLYLLAPANEAEAAELARQGIQYEAPTRAAIIAAFDHFKQARPGDFCVLHFSGHGSYMPAPDVFQRIEASGQVETLVSVDSRAGGVHDLIDKELAWLIADALHDPQTGRQKEAVHFLAVMDCCHAGSNTRDLAPDDDVAARMAAADTTALPTEHILGFEPRGNSLYLPFAPGQTRVLPGGLRHARYVSLAAARATELAQERSLSTPGATAYSRQRHGVFSFCLYTTLYQGGAQLSYRELIRRVEMEVRNRVNNQIPLLEMTDIADENAFFLRNAFQTPRPLYQVGFRLLPGMQAEWYLNGGAIQGLAPSGPRQKTTVQLNDGRLVEVLEVRSAESVLDPRVFTPEDQLNFKLTAHIATLAAARITTGCGADVGPIQRQALTNAWQQSDPTYVQFDPDAAAPDFVVRMSENGRFTLCKPGSLTPVFAPQDHAAEFWSDVHKVGKWMRVSALANPLSMIPRSDLQVELRVLEGTAFTADTLGHIPDEAYQPPLYDPEGVEARFVNGVQPAVQMSICNRSASRDYWVGALYLSANFGITHAYLECCAIGPGAGQREARCQFVSGGRIFPAIPLSIDRDFLAMGLSEITDYWIIVVSCQRFDLSRYSQPKVRLSDTRSAGFDAAADGLVPDDWLVIKIPLRISRSTG